MADFGAARLPEWALTVESDRMILSRWQGGRRCVFDRAGQTLCDSRGRVLGKLTPEDGVRLRDARIWQHYRFWNPIYGSVYRDGLTLIVAGKSICESTNSAEIQELGERIAHFMEVPLQHGGPARPPVDAEGPAMWIASILGLFSAVWLFSAGPPQGAADSRLIVTTVTGFLFGAIVGAAAPEAWKISGGAAWGAAALAIFMGSPLWAVVFVVAAVAGGFTGRLLGRVGRSSPSNT